VNDIRQSSSTDMLFKSKSTRRKRSMTEELEFDKMISEFVDKMKKAADKDIEMHSKKQPATYRHRLLPKLIDMMSRQDIHDLLLDNQILEGIRVWLEPFPDGVLPSVDIRTFILESLQSFPVDKIHLKESRLGRVVMYLYKNPRETKGNRKLAHQLIDKWSRSIVGSSIDYRDVISPRIRKPLKPSKSSRDQ
jgi:transcription factor SPN1